MNEFLSENWQNGTELIASPVKSNFTPLSLIVNAQKLSKYSTTIFHIRLLNGQRPKKLIYRPMKTV